MQSSWVYVTMLLCAACGAADRRGGVGSGLEQDAAGSTGGSAHGSAGRTGNGGAGGVGTAGAGGGSPSGKGGADAGVETGRDAGPRVADASADASMPIDAARDAASGVSPCAANHKTPAGRYRLQLHNVTTTYDLTSCESPDCECSDHTDAVEDGEATLVLEDDDTTDLDTSTGVPRTFPIAFVYGRLEAPTLTLDANVPGEYPPKHVEDYPPQTGTNTSGTDPFTPFWWRDDGVPNPYVVSTITPNSSAPCGGADPCPYDYDHVELTFDTVAWTIQFKRRFHQSGMCGHDLWVAVQTGTGYLDCGDE